MLPITLLPIFSKIFERLIFNSSFNYLMQNKVFTGCQPGFIPGDSCVMQLLSITHESYVLIATHQLTCGEFFLIFQKPLIKCGMNV